MTDKTKRKILLAVDGSENSLEIVRYAAKIPAFREMVTVLYNIHSNIPEGYLDLEKNSSAVWRTGEAKAWEKEHDRIIQGCMRKAENILQHAGFPKESVVVKIHNRKQGFARDIVNEAKRGYDGILVGRKGMTNPKNLLLGSIATKLIEKISFIPVVLVGENPKTGSVLLALDGSDNAARAVDYVGKILGDSDYAVRFIHVIRSDTPEYVEAKKMEISRVFDEAKAALEASGFDPERITTKVITGVRSRAAAVALEAREGGYGTIVAGRRGLSKVRDFLMGRVSNKLIHLAKNHAVWIIN